jgi:hypothetical protein
VRAWTFLQMCLVSVPVVPSSRGWEGYFGDQKGQESCFECLHMGAGESMNGSAGAGLALEYVEADTRVHGQACKAWLRQGCDFDVPGCEMTGVFGLACTVTFC